MQFLWMNKLWTLLLLVFLLSSTGCSHYQHLKKSGCSLGVKPVMVNPHWVKVTPNIYGVEAILLTMECEI